MPLLPLSDLQLVVIDLPGHGLSSYRPPGTFYTYPDRIIDLRRVVDYLGWKNYSLIGHSMGGAVAMAYAAFFSSEVDKVISLDRIRALVQPFDDLNSGIVNVSKLFDYEKRVGMQPPSYSKEEAVSRMVNALSGSCSPKSAEILLQRGARVTDGGTLVFTRDPRLKLSPIIDLHSDQMDVLAGNLKCHLLLIEAKDGIMYKNILEGLEKVEKAVNIYRSVAKSFKIVQVEGTHHVHLNNPERIAMHIKRFLNLKV